MLYQEHIEPAKFNGLPVVHVYFLCNILWPEVQPHSDNRLEHETAPYSTSVFGQAHHNGDHSSSIIGSTTNNAKDRNLSKNAWRLTADTVL